MRKKVIKSIYLFVVAFLLAILIASFCINKASEVKVSAYTKAYNIVSKVDIKDSIDIDLLLDNPNTFYSDKEQIEDAYILGEEGIIKLKIKEIYLENSKLEINEENYYIFHYIFEIDFDVKDNYELYLSEAYLDISFINGVRSNINIGSFSYYKYIDSDDDIMFSLLRVINSYKTDTNLYAIQLGIRNISTYDLVIKNIKFLDVNAIVGEEIKLEDKLESKKIEDYFINYKNIKEKVKFDIKINSNENVYYAIPLVNMDEYSLMCPLDKLAILIEYEINGESKVYIFENFLFYEQTFIDFSKYRFEIFTYDNR